MTEPNRRRFLSTMGGAAALLLGGPGGEAARAQAPVDPILAGRPLVRYPEKTDLILLTSRPPQLETPMTHFDRERRRAKETSAGPAAIAPRAAPSP